MRTLVISDLHLGTHTGRDVLRTSPPALGELTAVLQGVERLVLLGDVIELRHGPVRDAMAAATPVLAELGSALDHGAEVVIVPGNHDHHLLDPWLERAARKDAPPPLGLECQVSWRTGEPLALLARSLGVANVRACYPGVWLRPDVYATHGHYCDRHTTVPMFERLGAGAMARIVHEPADGPRRAEDYEAVLAPIYAWIHAIAQHGGPDLGRSSHGPSARAWRSLARRDGGLRRRTLTAAFPAAVGLLNRARIGPLTADLSGAELRRASLRAFAEVVDRLSVDAAHVIFGHTHRAGPLPADGRAEWRAVAGQQLINCGCWVQEPSFLGPDPGASPYRAGFGVRLDDSGPPVLEPLLDGLAATPGVKHVA